VKPAVYHTDPVAQPPSRKRLLALLALSAVSLLCTAALAAGDGHETVGPTTPWLPPSNSTFGDEVDVMFNFILYLTCFVNIAVFAALGWFLYKYRFNANRQATFIHGNNKLEAVWTLIPTIILVLIAVFSQTTWSRIKYNGSMPSGAEVVELEVIGKQFLWYFRYPGKDGKLGKRRIELINPKGSTPEEFIGLDRTDPDSKDDIISSVMYVPVNKNVRIHLTSVDVIHSFFLPNYRVKQDAMPGLMGNIWLNSLKTSAEVIGREASGKPKPFDIVCAELCGQGHFKMRGQMFVVTQDEYEKWMKSQIAKVEEAAEE